MAEAGWFDRLLAFAAPASVNALRDLKDNNQYQADIAQFQANPETFRPDLAKYSMDTGPKIGKYFDSRLQEGAYPALDKFALDYENLAGPDKRFFADPASREVLQQEGLQIPGGANPYIRKGLQDFVKQGQLENDFADLATGNAGPDTYGRIAANPLAQAQHNILNTLQTSQDKMATRADAQAKADEAKAKEGDVSGFQSAIAGLTAPMQGPVDLKRFAKRGGFDTFPGVESDIRQAAADYGVGDSDEVNKAITDARSTYKDTYLPQETVKVGRTTVTGQSNLLGDFKKDAGSTAPVTNVTVQGNKDRLAEFSLRKEFLALPEVKEFPTIEANSRRAISALNATGSKLAVDQALITTFNKMIDPSSVVRESEYARTPQDMAVLNRIKGKWGKIQEGGAGLPPEERQALARMISNFSTIASRQYNERANEYRQLATEYGFNPARVVARRNGMEGQKAAAPQVTPQQAAAELARRRGKK